MRKLSIVIKVLIFSFFAFLTVGIFSFKSHATNLMPSSLYVGVQFGNRLEFELVDYSDNVYYGLYYSDGTGNKPNNLTLYIFSESLFSVNYRYGNNASQLRIASQDPVNGLYYFSLVQPINKSNFNPFALDGEHIYLSKSDVVNDIPSQEPETSSTDFGLNDFHYYVGMDLLNADPDQDMGRHFIYHFVWNGSSNIDYPLTNVEYSLYGFLDSSISSDRIDQGYLIDSGSCSSVFDYSVGDVVYNFLGQSDYKKFVVYLTPHSNNYIGITSYVQCIPIVTTSTFDFYGLEIPYAEIVDNYFSSGEIYPVVNPSGVVDDLAVNYIGNAPSVGITYTEIGTLHFGDVIYNINSSYVYNPIIYGDTNTVNNYYDQVGDKITNNYNYNNVVNNYNYNKDVDYESNDSLNGILSLIQSLFTFFITFWAYIQVAIGFMPGWTVPVITSLFTAIGSIMIGSGILKVIGRFL